jgi:hypothetical protein
MFVCLPHGTMLTLWSVKGKRWEEGIEKGRKGYPSVDHDQNYFLPSDCYRFPHMGRPLWRKDESVVYSYNCFWALPVHSLRRTRDNTVPFETPPTCRARSRVRIPVWKSKSRYAWWSVSLYVEVSNKIKTKAPTTDPFNNTKRQADKHAHKKQQNKTKNRTGKHIWKRTKA